MAEEPRQRPKVDRRGRLIGEAQTCDRLYLMSGRDEG